jgi:DnaJ domain
MAALSSRAAATVLGVGPDADGDAVRDAYRRKIRECHPDVAGPGGAVRARLVNEAYRVLRSAARGIGDAPGSVSDASGSDASGSDASGSDASGSDASGSDASGSDAPGSDAPGSDRATEHDPSARLDGPDTLVLDEPPDVAFALVLQAAHEVGDVTYVDRTCAIVETVLSDIVDGRRRVRSVVVSFQGRGDGTTEAFVTLERIDGPAPGPDDLAVIARAFIAAIQARRSLATGRTTTLRV